MRIAARTQIDKFKPKKNYAKSFLNKFIFLSLI